MVINIPLLPNDCFGSFSADNKVPSLIMAIISTEECKWVMSMSTTSRVLSSFSSLASLSRDISINKKLWDSLSPLRRRLLWNYPSRRRLLLHGTAIKYPLVVTDPFLSGLYFFPLFFCLWDYFNKREVIKGGNSRLLCAIQPRVQTDNVRGDPCAWI